MFSANARRQVYSSSLFVKLARIRLTAFTDVTQYVIQLVEVMKRLITLFSVGLVALAAVPAWAGSGVDALTGFYERVNSFEARFTQNQLDEQGEVVQQSSGTFLLSRPARFRWEYQKPYEQIIVSNGTVFKFYDVDLAQVTVRDVDDSLRATPALLLSGGAALEDEFTILAAGEREGLTWVKLVPRNSEGDFQEIRMGFKGDAPERMELDDNLGQTTRIEFSQLEVNKAIPERRFDLTIPEGVEIVDGRAAAQDS